MITGLQSAQIEGLMPMLRPFFENIAGRSHSRWSVADIIEEASSGKVQTWVCGQWQAVALTRVWPDAVSIVACTGADREDWCDALETEIRAWARHLGKRHLLIDGRPGWSRWLRTKGYQEAHREMVIDLHG